MEEKHEKKRYWLKLDKNFLKNSQMKVLKSMPNGKDYIIFYLSLMLESVETVGHLRFTSLVPYNDEMLAAITETNVDIVRSAVKVFCELGLMQIFDDGTIFMPAVPKMTGKESESAERVREYRKRLKEKEEIKLLQCNNNVTECNDEVTKCNDNKEKEKDKEKDKQEDKETNIHSNNEQKQILLEHFEKIWREYPNKKRKSKGRRIFFKVHNNRKKDKWKEYKANRHSNFKRSIQIQERMRKKQN